MKFQKVDSLPKTVQREHKRRLEELMAFLAMNTRYVKVDFDGDYSSSHAARGALGHLADLHNLPIKVRHINGEIYLENLTFAKEDDA